MGSLAEKAVWFPMAGILDTDYFIPVTRLITGSRENPISRNPNPKKLPANPEMRMPGSRRQDRGLEGS
jgi:hypothetical protein